MGSKSRFSGTGDDAILLNKLTVGDARHILRTEGGVLTASGIAIQVITILAVSIFSARAILLGEATVWHLMLPMVAEYLILLIVLPPLSLFLRDAQLKIEAGRSLWWVGVVLALGAGWIAFEADRNSQPWRVEAATRLAGLRDWIVDAKIHWAILAAVLGRIGNLPARIAAFHQHGPPFAPVGIGCGMRMGLFVLGVFFLPWVLAASGKVVWALWGLILLAEAAALWMHLDIQMRLKKKGIAI